MGVIDQVKSYLIEALPRIADFAKALRLDSVAAIAYQIRGLAYLKKGDWDQAIADCDQALCFAVAYNNRGLTYRLASPLVGLVIVLSLLGFAVAYNNRIVEYLAIILFFVFVIVPPLLGFSIAYNNRGLTYHLAGHLIAVFVIVLSLLGLAVAYNNPTLIVLVVRLIVLVVVSFVVLLLFIRIFKGFAALAEAYKIRGDAYHELDEYDQAVADYTKALDLDPEYVVAYKIRGDAYYELDKYDQAIDDYTKALDLDPEYAVAYNNRGFAYYYRGLGYGGKKDYDRAKTDYSKVIKLKPNHAISYLNRADLYQLMFVPGKPFDTDKFDLAIEDYDNTVRLCPDYRKDFIDDNFAYGGKAAAETAVVTLEMKIGVPPGSATDYYYLGVRSLFINNRRDAWVYFAKAKVLGYSGEKLTKHLDNLNDFSKKIKGSSLLICVFSGKLGITKECLRGILRTLT